MAAVQGERGGRFHPCYRRGRHQVAVRQHSVAVTQDTDPCHDETLIALHGGAVVRVPATMDEVLTWLA
jgi:hypothetical protein